MEVEDLKAKDEQKSQELNRKEEEIQLLQSKLHLTEVNPYQTVHKEVCCNEDTMDTSTYSSKQVKHMQETLVI